MNNALWLAGTGTIWAPRHFHMPPSRLHGALSTLCVWHTLCFVCKLDTVTMSVVLTCLPCWRVTPPTVDANLFIPISLVWTHSKQKPHWSNSLKHEHSIYSRYGVHCHKSCLITGFSFIIITATISIPPISPEQVPGAVLIVWVSVLACIGFYLIKLMAKFPPIMRSQVS